MASEQNLVTAKDPRGTHANSGHHRLAPRGKYTVAGRIRTFFNPARMLILLVTIAAVVAAILKTPCRAGGWGAPEVYFAGCYADWTGLWTSRGFADDPWAPFRFDSGFEYPILIAVVASILAWLAHAISAGAESLGLDVGANVVFYDLNFLAVVALWMLVTVVVAKLASIRYWDAAMVAVAPGIIFAGFINWDMWAVAFMVTAMWAFAKHRYVLAGVLIGLGAAVKLFPLFLLGAIIVLAIRSGRYYPLVITAAGAVIAWLTVNLPLMVFNPDAWAVFYEYSSTREPGWSSIWHAYTTATGADISGDQLSGWAFWSFVAACAVIAVVGLTTRRRPRLAQLMFLIVAAFILVNKVYSPQFVLWLIPLIVLALPGWRDFLIFSAAELLHFWAIWGYLSGQTSGFDSQHLMDDTIYVAAVGLHVIVLVYLMIRVLVDMYDPINDPVRIALAEANHPLLPVDDPLGAEFDDADDAFVLRPRLDSKHDALS
ncbi:MAG: glycosyltransferase 87 family protein [Yaniella sp.]|nr:glycosyltransferase 87 family protein [Yaniella sp.]